MELWSRRFLFQEEKQVRGYKTGYYQHFSLNNSSEVVFLLPDKSLHWLKNVFIACNFASYLHSSKWQDDNLQSYYHTLQPSAWLTGHLDFPLMDSSQDKPKRLLPVKSSPGLALTLLVPWKGWDRGKETSCWENWMWLIKETPDQENSATFHEAEKTT